MAAPAFGFSFGDIVQAISLINDVRKALKDSGGAKDEFRQVLIDLQQLEIVLQQLDRGGWDKNSDPGHTNAIKGMALTCQVPLRAFLDKIERYNILWEQERRTIKSHVKSGARKLEWALKMQEETSKFRAVILSKIVTISLLIALPMFSTVSKIDSTTQAIESSITDTKDSLSAKLEEHRTVTEGLIKDVGDLKLVQAVVSLNTRRLVSICAGIQVGVENFRKFSITQHEKIRLQLDSIERAQQHCMAMVPAVSLGVVKYTSGLVTKLEQLVEYFGGYTVEILQILRRMVRTDLEMYALLRQVLDELPRAPRFAAQNCIDFTDALGRNELLPYQWFQEWEIFESMLKVKFKDLPGEHLVKTGHYLMLNTKQMDGVIDRLYWKQSVFPGAVISMSIVIIGQHFIRGICPRPGCEHHNDMVPQLIATELTVCSACGLEYRYSDPTSNEHDSSIAISNAEANVDQEHGSTPQVNIEINPQTASTPEGMQIDRGSEHRSGGMNYRTESESNTIRIAWARELRAFKKVHVSATGNFSSKYEALSDADYREDEIEVKGLTLWLSPLDYRERQEQCLRISAPGTCRWFFESEKYKGCVEKERDSLLCYGGPGTGKTTLMAMTVQHLQQRFSNKKSVGIAYLFINYKDRNTISSLLGCICRQLLPFPPDDGLIRSYNKRHSRARGAQASKAEVLYALRQTVKSYTRVIVLIDGVDELSDGLLRYEIFSELQKLSVQTFATSRPEQKILDYFKLRKDILLEISTADLELYSYIRRTVVKSTVISRLIRLDNTALERITTAVFNNSQGMFLLAQLLIESIAQSRPDSKDRLNRALRTLPKSLEQAYSFLYSRLIDQIHSYAESPLRILAWLSHIGIPVTLTELRKALAVDLRGTIDKDNMITEELFTECCAGLLTYDEDTSVVRWVHITAEEYFKSRREDLFPSERNEIMKIRPQWLDARTRATSPGSYPCT